MGIINLLSGILWNYLMVTILAFGSLYFLYKVKFLNILGLKRAIKLLGRPGSGSHMSSTSVMLTALAAIVGVGNLAGVPLAISLAGPGAIFWMWVSGLLVGSLSLAENTLGQVYKRKTIDNTYTGGPAYYVKYGVKNSYMAKFVAILFIISFGVAFTSLQAHTIVDSVSNLLSGNFTFWLGILIALLSAIVLFLGIRFVVAVCSFLVPFMVIAYLLLATVAIAMNFSQIPEVFSLIFRSAFNIKEFTGGVASYSIMHIIVVGVKRALFASEAGMGSAPNISASGHVSHPVQQGLKGALAILFVSLVVCTATALVILSSDVSYDSGTIVGINMLGDALYYNFNYFGYVALSFIIFVFGFSSIIGNYSYSESNARFLGISSRGLVWLRVLVIGAVVMGTNMELLVVWSLADIFMALLIIMNLYALFRLSKVVGAVVNNYKERADAYDSGEVKFEGNAVAPYLEGDDDNYWNKKH